VLVISEEGAFY